MQKLRRDGNYVGRTRFGYQSSRNSLTMKEMFSRFIKYKRTEGLSFRTIDDHEKNFGYILDFTGRDLYRDEINEEFILEYKDFMVNEKKYAPATVNIRLRSLKTFLKFCYDQDYLVYPYYKDIKLVKASIDNVKSLSVEELQDLLGAMDENWFTQFRDKVITLILIDTMARITELMSVKREDINLEEGTIYLKADNTKTREGRYLPLSPTTKQILTQFMLETEDFNSEYLFTTYMGKKLSPDTYRKALIDYGRKAGIKGNVHPHKLRHTGALMYTLNGGDPFSLQKILGHSDLSMTRRYVQMANAKIIDRHDKFSPINNLLENNE